jgi:hypothetical protein
MEHFPLTVPGLLDYDVDGDYPPLEVRKGYRNSCIGRWEYPLTGSGGKGWALGKAATEHQSLMQRHNQPQGPIGARGT